MYALYNRAANTPHAKILNVNISASTRFLHPKPNTLVTFPPDVFGRKLSVQT